MPSWLDASIFGITIFIMLVGLVGIMVPFFPGIVIIWLAALFYGIVVGFTTLGWVLFFLITLAGIAGVTVDNVLMGLGARRGGASWWTIGVAWAAGILGTIVFPPFGGLIAAPLSVLVIEYYRVRDWKKARSAFSGLAVGWGLSFLARFGFGLLMIFLWFIWAVWR
jgi:uncharacterized protein